MPCEVDKHGLECRTDETVRHSDQECRQVKEVYRFKEYKAGESRDHE